MNSKASPRPQVSEHGRFNQYLRASADFFYAELFFRLFTFIWLYWALQKFDLYLDRPTELFEPLNMVGRVVAPAFPQREVFWLIIGIAALANLGKVFYKRCIIPQVVLAAALLWINLVLWSYGYLPHVNHLFLLAHLFLIFVTVERPGVNKADQVQQQSINWLYFGLLFVYTLSGGWKIAALGRKLLSPSDNVHWLKPEAALYNALVSFRDYDQPLAWAHLFIEYSWVWQIGFVLVVYILTSAIVAAWHPPLRPWMGSLLICFHLINQFAFLIYFVVACLTILCLFFPYTLVFRQCRAHYRFPADFYFTGQKRRSTYVRKYEDGLEDVFHGFEAYRQRLLDKNYYLAGLLYFPGIQLVAQLWWRLTGSKAQNEVSIS